MGESTEDFLSRIAKDYEGEDKQRLEFLSTWSRLYQKQFDEKVNALIQQEKENA